MQAYVPAFLVAAAAALVLTPLFRALAVRVGAVHRPISRSVHTRPVPFLGGLALYFAFGAAIALTLGLDSPPVRGILAGATAILLLGLADDAGKSLGRPMPAKLKFLGQVAAAAIPVAYGMRVEWITNPFAPAGMTYVGLWGIPITLLWTVSVVNVTNLIDGLDGLAAGVSTIAALTLVAVGVQTGQPAVGVALAAALAGSTVGFLPYNFNPAKIFMGDTGSMFLGYLLAAAAVEGTLKSAATVGLGVPILALGVPILDTAFAIVRRVSTGRPFYQADRDHLHHRLLALGLSHRQTVLLMWAVSAAFGTSALALVQLGLASAAVGILALIGGLSFAAQRSGILAVRRDAAPRSPD